MSQTTIIKEAGFMASPLRELVLGLCAEGRYTDARAHLDERMRGLDDEDELLECRNLLCVVLRGEKKYADALTVHLESYPLAEATPYDILRARFHGGMGITYEMVARDAGIFDYFEKALAEYQKATHYFQQTGDIDGAGDVENNTAMLLCALGRTEATRGHLAQARAYFEGQPVKLAQVDDTEARICLKENKPLEALDLAASAVRVFIRHSEVKLLEEAMRTMLKATADYRCEV